MEIFGRLDRLFFKCKGKGEKKKMKMVKKLGKENVESEMFCLEFEKVRQKKFVRNGGKVGRKWRQSWEKFEAKLGEIRGKVGRKSSFFQSWGVKSWGDFFGFPNFVF